MTNGNWKGDRNDSSQSSRGHLTNSGGKGLQHLAEMLQRAGQGQSYQNRVSFDPQLNLNSGSSNSSIPRNIYNGGGQRAGFGDGYNKERFQSNGYGGTSSSNTGAGNGYHINSEYSSSTVATGYPDGNMMYVGTYGVTQSNYGTYRGAMQAYGGPSGGTSSLQQHQSGSYDDTQQSFAGNFYMNQRNYVMPQITQGYGSIQQGQHHQATRGNSAVPGISVSGSGVYRGTSKYIGSSGAYGVSGGSQGHTQVLQYGTSHHLTSNFGDIPLQQISYGNFPNQNQSLHSISPQVSNTVGIATPQQLYNSYNFSRQSNCGNSSGTPVIGSTSSVINTSNTSMQNTLSTINGKLNVMSGTGSLHHMSNTGGRSMDQLRRHNGGGGSGGGYRRSGPYRHDGRTGRVNSGGSGGSSSGGSGNQGGVGVYSQANIGASGGGPVRSSKDRGPGGGIGPLGSSNVYNKKLINDRSYPTHFITDFREFNLRRELDGRVDNMLPKVYVDKALAAGDEFVRLVSTARSCRIPEIRPALLITSLPNCDSFRLYLSLMKHYRGQNVSKFKLMVATYPETGLCKGWAVVLLLDKNAAVEFLISSHFQWRGICVKAKPLLNPDLFSFNCRFMTGLSENSNETVYQIPKLYVSNLANSEKNLEENLNFDESKNNKDKDIDDNNDDNNNNNNNSNNNNNDDDDGEVREYMNISEKLYQLIEQLGLRNPLEVAYNGNSQRRDVIFVAGRKLYASFRPQKILKVIFELSKFGRTIGELDQKEDDDNEIIVEADKLELLKPKFSKDTDHCTISKYALVNLYKGNICKDSGKTHEYLTANLNGNFELEIDNTEIDAPLDCNLPSSQADDIKLSINILPKDMGDVFPWGIRYFPVGTLGFAGLDLIDSLSRLVRRLHCKNSGHKWFNDVDYEGFPDDHLHLQGFQNVTTASMDISLITTSNTDQNSCTNVTNSGVHIGSLSVMNNVSICNQVVTLDSMVFINGLPNLSGIQIELDFMYKLRNLLNLSKAKCDFWSVELFCFPETERLRGDGFILLPSSCNSKTLLDQFPIDEESGNPNIRISNEVSAWILPYNMYQDVIYEDLKVLAKLLGRLVSFWSYHVNGKRHPLKLLDSIKTKFSTAEINSTKEQELSEDNQNVFHKPLDLNLQALGVAIESIAPLTTSSGYSSISPSEEKSLVGIAVSAEEWLHGLPKLVAEGIDERALDCSVVHFVRTYFFSAENLVSLHPFNLWLEVTNEICETNNEGLIKFEKDDRLAEDSAAIDELSRLLLHPLPSHEIVDTLNNKIVSANHILASILSQHGQIGPLALLDMIDYYIQGQFGLYNMYKGEDNEDDKSSEEISLNLEHSECTEENLVINQNREVSVDIEFKADIASDSENLLSLSLKEGEYRYREIFYKINSEYLRNMPNVTPDSLKNDSDKTDNHEVNLSLNSAVSSKPSLGFSCSLWLERWGNNCVWGSCICSNARESVMEAAINFLRHFALLECRRVFQTIGVGSTCNDPLLAPKRTRATGTPVSTAGGGTSGSGGAPGTNLSHQNSLSSSGGSNTNSNLSTSLLSSANREHLSIADRFEGLWNFRNIQVERRKVRCVSIPGSLPFEKAQKLWSVEYLLALISCGRMRYVPISLAFRTPLYRKNAYRYVQERFRRDSKYVWSHVDQLWSNKLDDVVANAIGFANGDLLHILAPDEGNIQDNLLDPKCCFEMLKRSCKFTTQSKLISDV
ncbi:hypothetical protein cand_006820 [Cryptosporidium andersoni]|uniref:Uncharacterized protein n=1 Tax=Cryptosporidium andersoni TaxID=117008 RepID=A0A1J4MT64_9CRYT|nr:hypothetical protein cand_006820 [Cryptosporidium andersoni]